MNPDSTNILFLAGNPSSSDHQDWSYNNDMIIKGYNQPYDVVGVTMTDADMVQTQNFIDSYNPASGIASPSSTPTLSPQPSLSRPARSSSRKEKMASRKTRAFKPGTASEEDSPENKSMRRREQNRIAQRTFRERKDRYIQNLELHIKDLNAKQQSLEASYKKSTYQVSTLYTHLVELQAELDYWRSFAHTSAEPSTSSGMGSSMQNATPIPTTHAEAEPLQTLQIHRYCAPRPAFSHLAS